MAHNLQNPMGEEMSSSQMDSTSKNCHIHWNDAMDSYMISSLYHQVSKVIESVYNGCGVVVSKKSKGAFEDY